MVRCTFRKVRGHALYLAMLVHANALLLMVCMDFCRSVSFSLHECGDCAVLAAAVGVNEPGVAHNRMQQSHRRYKYKRWSAGGDAQHPRASAGAACGFCPAFSRFKLLGLPA